MKRTLLAVLLALSACAAWPPPSHAQPVSRSISANTVGQLLEQQFGLPAEPLCTTVQKSIAASTSTQLATADPARFYVEASDVDFGNCLLANSATNANSVIGRAMPPAGGTVVIAYPADLEQPTTEQWVNCAFHTFVNFTTCDLQ